MRVNSPTRYVALAALVGALACAGNTARTSDEAAAARDTTASDTLGGENQNPAGYRGMERDTATAPQYPETSDTFLQNQGPGQPHDTAGYSGLERDTTAASAAKPDSTGAMTDSTGATGMDSTGMSRTGDTTGYDPSQQQPKDSTSR